MYEEYIKYPLITKKRMFYETMEDILPRLKVIINGSDGTQTLLPLDSFVGTGQGGQNSESGASNAAGTSGEKPASQSGQAQE